MLRIFGLVCVVLAAPTLAFATEKRAREMAECGYLTVVAADAAAGQTRKNLVRDAVDFTNLYYALAAIDRPAGAGTKVTAGMLRRMTDTGHALHSRRLTAMSETGALRLSNRLLADCRADLALLAAKYRAEAGLPPRARPAQ